MRETAWLRAYPYKSTGKSGTKTSKVREWFENTYPDIKRPAKEEKGDIEALGNQEGYTSEGVGGGVDGADTADGSVRGERT